MSNRVVATRQSQLPVPASDRAECAERILGLPAGAFPGLLGLRPERRGQDLTTIEAESLDNRSASGLSPAMADARRNAVTRGVQLNALVGHRFTIGGVQCYGARLAEPCGHLERLTTRGVLRGLVHRSGIRSDVLGDGELRVGDEIRVAPGKRSGR